MSGDVLRGKWGLVTGASSGLGVDFAKELAARGCNLILVARRADLLRQQAAALAGQYGVTVEVIPLDLAAPDAPQALYGRTRDLGRDVAVLINNAGYAIYGPFVETPWDRERDMLELDIVTLVGLTKFFARDIVARGSGFILLLASIGAFQPTPLYATYSAAKSFVLNFGEALNHELRRTGVRCTVLSPGITATEFLRVSGQEATAYQRLMMMRSADVARIGVAALLEGRPSVVPGWLNALTAWSNRLIPRRLSAALAARLMS